MKSNLLKYSSFASLIIALIIGFTSNAQQFDASKYEFSFDLKMVKQADNTRLLEVNFTAANSEDSNDLLIISDAEIKFYNVLEDKEVVIGSAKTTKKGIATFNVPADYKYMADQDGYITISARYEGSQVIDPLSAERIFKDLNLTLELIEEEGVRTIKAKAYTLNNAGEEVPVEADLYFFADGMLSKMKLDEATLEEGAYEYEFEYLAGLPGDAEGNINFSVVVEDHDDFGNVVQKKTINWGTPSQYVAETNKLWSEAAPYWMYIVLTIMLVGVWANFVYTGFNLYKIKKEGDKDIK